jgi:hypothetical protein
MHYSWQDPLDDQSWWGQVWHAEQSAIVVDSARQLFACPSLALQIGKTAHALAAGAVPELQLRKGATDMLWR